MKNKWNKSILRAVTGFSLKETQEIVDTFDLPKSKHTPGPWIAVEDDTIFYIDVPDNQDNSKLNGVIADSIKSKANASLIAASPEMVKVLQQIVDKDLIGGHDELYHELKTVLAKARGES